MPDESPFRNLTKQRSFVNLRSILWQSPMVKISKPRMWRDPSEGQRYCMKSASSTHFLASQVNRWTGREYRLPRPALPLTIGLRMKNECSARRVKRALLTTSNMVAPSRHALLTITASRIRWAVRLYGVRTRSSTTEVPPRRSRPRSMSFSMIRLLISNKANALRSSSARSKSARLKFEVSCSENFRYLRRTFFISKG